MPRVEPPVSTSFAMTRACSHGVDRLCNDLLMTLVGISVHLPGGAHDYYDAAVFFSHISEHPVTLRLQFGFTDLVVHTLEVKRYT